MFILLQRVSRRTPKLRERATGEAPSTESWRSGNQTQKKPVKQFVKWHHAAKQNAKLWICVSALNPGGLGNGRGWDPDEMFRQNEAKYGVQSSFKENLEGYTIQLKDTNTAEYR